MSDKPLKVRPQLYAVYFGGLRTIAMDMGYNLLIHGSMDRDLDLVAVPWTDEPKTHHELLQAFHMYLIGFKLEPVDVYLEKVQPGGRKSYAINLNRGKYTNGYFDDDRHDEQYYIDISITPFIKSTP